MTYKILSLYLERAILIAQSHTTFTEKFILKVKEPNNKYVIALTCLRLTFLAFGNEQGT